MTDMDLQSTGPRGVPTWHSRVDASDATIDLMLLTPELTQGMYFCTIDKTEHGSNHSAIRTELAIGWRSPRTKPRRLWKQIRWIEVRLMVEASLQAHPGPSDPTDVDGHCKFIMGVVLPIVETHVPVAKPSPYARK